MGIAITEDHRTLADVAADFLADRGARAAARSLLETDVESLPSWWSELAELGWLGLPFPEEVGGLGLGFFEASLVLQKLASTLVPEPYLASVVLAGSAVLHGATKAEAKALLEPMIEGRTSLALAWAERHGRYDAGHVTTTARADGGAWKLTG